MSFSVIIPARYDSTRLQGKVLLDIAGKPMVQRVYEQAQKSGAEQIFIATDDKRVQQTCLEFTDAVYMTRADHSTGTDRSAELMEEIGFADDAIIVNLQGDEPLIPPQHIAEAAQALAQSTELGAATLATPIHSYAEIADPNIVKVVLNKHNEAVYFSRAKIAWLQPEFNEQSVSEHLPLNHYRHIGLYAYRAAFLRQYVAWEPSPLEQMESLEQLRILWYGEKIKVHVVDCHQSIGVDTAADLARVRELVTQ